MAIKEKVKQYIMEQNAQEGVSSSISGDMDTPATLVAKVPIGNDSSAPINNTAQDRVEKSKFVACDFWNYSVLLEN